MVNVIESLVIIKGSQLLVTELLQVNHSISLEFSKLDDQFKRAPAKRAPCSPRWPAGQGLGVVGRLLPVTRVGGSLMGDPVMLAGFRYAHCRRSVQTN